MAGVAKHPNEFNLTRWYIAYILDKSDEEDLSWLREEVGGFAANLYRRKAGRRAIMWQKAGGMLAKINERFPGSSEIFLGTAGQILMGERPTKVDLHGAMMGMGDPHRTILLGGGYGPNSEARKSRAIAEVFDELELFPALSTIHAIIFMLSGADREQNHDTWNATCRFYRHMIPQFVVCGHLKHYEIIFDAIDTIAPFRNFRANDRHDRFMNWRREIPRIKKLRKHYACQIMDGWEKSQKILMEMRLLADELNARRPQLSALVGHNSWPEKYR